MNDSGNDKGGYSQHENRKKEKVMKKRQGNSGGYEMMIISGGSSGTCKVSHESTHKYGYIIIYYFSAYKICSYYI